MTTVVRPWLGRDESPPTSVVSPILQEIVALTYTGNRRTHVYRKSSHSRARLEVPRPNHALTCGGHVLRKGVQERGKDMHSNANGFPMAVPILIRDPFTY